MPIFIKATKGSKEYPIRLVTPHSKESLFNQHIGDSESISKKYISIENLSNLQEGDIVIVSSKKGSILSQLKVDSTLKKDEAYIFMQWSKKQGNPNFLTSSIPSDIGGQVAYYDTFINIKKYNTK